MIIVYAILVLLILLVGWLHLRIEGDIPPRTLRFVDPLGRLVLESRLFGWRVRRWHRADRRWSLKHRPGLLIGQCGTIWLEVERVKR